MTIHSQNNEQQVLMNYFRDEVGLFVDIGANDGITLSNTYGLFENGWEGICIEPEEVSFQKLHQLYKDKNEVSCLNGAVSTRNGLSVLMASGGHLGTGDTGLLSSLKQSECGRWHETEFNPQNVQCFTWQRIVNIFELEDIDFISIDAEGMDLEILHQIDLTNVRAICVEHNGVEEVYNDIVSYCGKFGLTRSLLVNRENVILAR